MQADNQDPGEMEAMQTSSEFQPEVEGRSGRRKSPAPTPSPPNTHTCRNYSGTWKKLRMGKKKKRSHCFLDKINMVSPTLHPLDEVLRFQEFKK